MPESYEEIRSEQALLQPDLSVVVPIYNEIESLVPMVGAVRQALRDTGRCSTTSCCSSTTARPTGAES
jgi:hypothetical protein